MRVSHALWRGSAADVLTVVVPFEFLTIALGQSRSVMACFAVMLRTLMRERVLHTYQTQSVEHTTASMMSDVHIYGHVLT